MECGYSLIAPMAAGSDTILPGFMRERFPPDLVFEPIQPMVIDGCSVFTREKKHAKTAAGCQQIQLTDIYYGPYSNGFKPNYNIATAETTPPSLQLPRVVKGINSEEMGKNIWEDINAEMAKAADKQAEKA